MPWVDFHRISRQIFGWNRMVVNAKKVPHYFPAIFSGWSMFILHNRKFIEELMMMRAVHFFLPWLHAASYPAYSPCSKNPVSGRPDFSVIQLCVVCAPHCTSHTSIGGYISMQLHMTVYVCVSVPKCKILLSCLLLTYFYLFMEVWKIQT